MLPWVSTPTIVPFSSNTFVCVGGEGQGEGELTLRAETSWRTTKRETRHSATNVLEPRGEGLLNQPPKRCYAESCGSNHRVTNHEGFSSKLCRRRKTGGNLQSGEAG